MITTYTLRKTLLITISVRLRRYTVDAQEMTTNLKTSTVNFVPYFVTQLDYLLPHRSNNFSMSIMVVDKE